MRKIAISVKQKTINKFLTNVYVFVSCDSPPGSDGDGQDPEGELQSVAEDLNQGGADQDDVAPVTFWVIMLGEKG